MNVFLLLCFMMPLGLNYQDKQYDHRDSECSYSYTITKSWELTLKARGTFNLKFSKTDTRYKKKMEFEFLGTWENKNDTVTLDVSLPSPNNCYFKNAKYVLAKDVLKSVAMNNSCLPATFELKTDLSNAQ